MTLAESRSELQVVVFGLSGQAYGVEIGAVREIIRMQNVTMVPGTPDYVEGVINLRGKVIPVLDLRKRFSLLVGRQTRESRIVVVDVGKQDIGLIVDAVTEVLRIATSAIQPPKSVLSTGNADYLMGIAKLEGRLIILLDLKRVLSAQDLGGKGIGEELLAVAAA